MRPVRLLLPLVMLVAACDSQAKEHLRELAHTDSLRTDSIVAIKNDLLNEVMASTQFVNDLNTEIAKVKTKRPARLNTKLSRESDLAAVKEERATVVTRIQELVARLDSSEKRVASLQARAARLSKHDATIVAQVAAYQKTITDLRQTVERQKAEYEATIAGLTARVDTVTRDNVRLASEKLALTDTVAELTNEKNAAYYVIGTKDELVRNGILVEEGHKRFFLLGGRTVSPARDLDPAKFTKIDRLRDRVIKFPDGDYTIFTRQNPTYASPLEARDGKMAGGLRIDDPDHFWEPSKFLIIVKS
jgi:Membrane-bound metallopeptidase